MRAPSAAECALATEAVRTGFGLDDATLTPIPTWRSTVFRVDSSQGRFAARMDRAASGRRPHVACELAFLRHLDACGVRVPHPRPAVTGEDILVVADDSGHERTLDLTTWVDGVVRRDGLEPADAAELGATLARIHRAARDFAAPPPQPRERPVGDPLRMLTAASAADAEQLAPGLSGAQRRILERCLDAIVPVVSALGPLDSGVLHKDFILGNCLWQGRAVAVIDFADLDVGPFLYDLAPMLTNIGDEPPLRAAFLAAYRDGFGSTAEQEAVLPVLEAVRHASSVFSTVGLWLRGLHGPDPVPHLRYRLGEIERLMVHAAELA